MKKERVELYGDGIGTVELVDYMGNDLTIVNAARVSFGKHKLKLDEKDKKLIKYLAEHKHTSTFEHNVATFRFVVPLFVRSQHHRHRTWSYNEISRRYTGYNIQFYEPELFRTQHDSNRQASKADQLINPLIDQKNIAGGQCANYLVHVHHLSSIRLYEKLIQNGICREQARGVLPQNMYTEYYGTSNLNNLIKFIHLRIHEGAQWEIQRVAEAILEIIAELWPAAVDPFRDLLESGEK